MVQTVQTGRNNPPRPSGTPQEGNSHVQFVRKCPVCGDQESYSVTASGLKNGDVIRGVCKICRERLHQRTAAILPDTNQWGKNDAEDFLRILCNKGNPHAIALARSLI